MTRHLALVLFNGLVQRWDTFDDGDDTEWLQPLSASTVLTVPLPEGATRLGLHLRWAGASEEPVASCGGQALARAADERWDVSACAAPVELRFPEARASARLDAMWAWTDVPGPGCGEADRAAARATWALPAASMAGLRDETVYAALAQVFAPRLAQAAALVSQGVPARVPSGEFQLDLARSDAIPGVRRGAPVVAWNPAGACAWLDRGREPGRIVTGQLYADAALGWASSLRKVYGQPGRNMALEAELGRGLSAQIETDGSGWSLSNIAQEQPEPTRGLPWPVPPARQLGTPWPAAAQDLADALLAQGAAAAAIWAALEGGPEVRVAVPDGLLPPGLVRAKGEVEGRHQAGPSGDVIAWHEAGGWGAATGLGSTRTVAVIERDPAGALRALTVLHQTEGAWWNGLGGSRDDTWQVWRIEPSGAGLLRAHLEVPVAGGRGEARLERVWIPAG